MEIIKKNSALLRFMKYDKAFVFLDSILNGEKTLAERKPGLNAECAALCYNEALCSV